MTNPTPLLARIEVDGQLVCVDLADGVDLSIPVTFSDSDPSLYTVPHAQEFPLEMEGMVGDSRLGGSCNVSVLTITPHCNGTHTESVGHITQERRYITDILPIGLIPCTVVSVTPEPIGLAGESSSPPLVPASPEVEVGSDPSGPASPEVEVGSDPSGPASPAVEVSSAPLQPDPVLGITAQSLMRAWPALRSDWNTALIIRTLPNPKSKTSQSYHANDIPFFTIEAMNLLRQRGVKHVLVDLPSLDRLHDDGHMAAHRTWWNMEPGSFLVPPAEDALRTVTELIFVPNQVADGKGFVCIQIPAFQSDAAPSRPIFYPLQSA